MKKAFTLIELILVVVIAVIVAVIAIPNVLHARKDSNEASAVASLRTINASEAIYLERNGSEEYGTLKDLCDDNHIDQVLGSGQKRGYRFSVTPGKPRGYEYTADAAPRAEAIGDRYFFTDQGCVIRVNQGSPATAHSKALIGGR